MTELRHPYWPDLTDDEGDILVDYFDAICGDCKEGRCHVGSVAAAAWELAAGRHCGCVRHAESVVARQFEASHAEYGDRCAVETAKAWHAVRSDPQLSDLIAMEG